MTGLTKFCWIEIGYDGYNVIFKLIWNYSCKLGEISVEQRSHELSFKNFFSEGQAWISWTFCQTLAQVKIFSLGPSSEPWVVFLTQSHINQI